MSMRSHYCGLVTEALMGQTVSLCGWVNRRRDHGGVIFVDVRDREGYVQVVCDPDRADMFKTAEGLRNEFCIQIKGLVRARPEGTTNDGLKSGKIEILCHELTVLNPSVTPPFLLDDDNLSETTRLTHRVLDLRRPYMQNNLMLRYKVAMETRKFLDEHGFGTDCACRCAIAALPNQQALENDPPGNQRRDEELGRTPRGQGDDSPPSA